MKKMKVLLIDDEEDFLKITRLNLEDTGKFEVMALNNAKEIILQLHNFKPDIILLDLLMAGLGGIEACDMLNKDPIGQKTPIIVLTALDNDADKLTAYKKGIVDYLAKPIDKDTLVAKIEKALENK